MLSMMNINSNVTKRFITPEFHHFNWLFSVSPCFPVKASSVKIISDPSAFYDTLCHKFDNAKLRISVASLYIGTGPLEKKLLQLSKENMIRNKNLQLKVLLDHQRGMRGTVNSLSLLKYVYADNEQCKVSLYQTPRLCNSWSKYLPGRYNELVGLQHMKLYIVDNTVLLSGANCSSDYFQQRQDRYIEIEDENVANFYCELIDVVCDVSNRCVKNQMISKQEAKRQMIQEAKENVTKLINDWKLKQQLKDQSSDNDTWIFPLLQMSDFNITQDEHATQRLLECVPKGSYIRLATGYFNLTEKYSRTLLKRCKANVSLLMAHPNANGFLGASGPAGGIPHAYSLISKKFWKEVEKWNQISRVRMLEYERPGWTFHAKGLWYYPPGCDVPWATIVGSANLGERSVYRDLEAQAIIFTTSPVLQRELHEECSTLHEYASECSGQLKKRQIPLWVQATVGLFRTYF